MDPGDEDPWVEDAWLMFAAAVIVASFLIWVVLAACAAQPVEPLPTTTVRPTLATVLVTLDTTG